MSANGLVESYRKYRPVLFKDVLGQPEAVKVLANYLKTKTMPHVLLFAGGTGCLRGDMAIYDPVDGTTKSVKSRWSAGIPFNVLSLNVAGQVVVGQALPPVQYPPTRILRIETEQSVFFVTGEHRFCHSARGEYLSAISCEEALRRYERVHLLSTEGLCQSACRQDGRRSMEIPLDCQGSCHPSAHYDDAPLLPVEEIGRGFAQLPNDALEFYHNEHADGLEHGPKHNHHYLLSDLPSTTRSFRRDKHAILIGSLSYEENWTQSFQSSSTVRQRHAWIDQKDSISVSPNPRPASAEALCNKSPSAFSNPPMLGVFPEAHTTVLDVSDAGQEEYYDFHVLTYNNYWMGGLFHHNCGKTTLSRILKDKLHCHDMDFVEINAADTRGIDTIREIQIDSRKRAWASGNCRIWFLDEIHRATTDSQQCLLKLLEDVPEHAYFFLASSEPHKLIPALRGRCTPIHLARLGLDTLRQIAQRVLDERRLSLPDDVFDALVEKADGSGRQALLLLDKVLTLTNPTDQMRVLQQGDDQEKRAEDLLKLLIKPGTKWNQVVPFLREMGDDVESFRRRVLGYAGAMLLSGNDHAGKVIANIQYNTFEGGKAVFYLMCWNLLNPRR